MLIRFAVQALVVLNALTWAESAETRSTPWGFLSRRNVSEVVSPKGGKSDVLATLLAKLGLSADPITLSILAGAASILAVVLRQAATSAASTAKQAIHRALYVEVTVSEKDDPKLYKAMVRWLGERGMLDRIPR